MSDVPGTEPYPDGINIMVASHPRVKHMSCTEKAILLRQYQEHVRLYVATVRKLSGLTRAVPAVEWDLAWQLAVHARQICQIKRELLEAHVANHCC